MRKKILGIGKMQLGCICVLVFACLGCADGWAAERTSMDVLDKRFALYGGVQFLDAEGEFSSTEEGRPKITLDLDDLGLDEDQTSVVLGINYKLSKRWHLRLDYYGYHEDAVRTAEFEFNFEDLVVPVGARIDSNIDLDLYVLNLSYNLIHSERARFGLGIGVHAADLDLDISARLTVGDTETPLGEGEEDFIAPLPNIYASGAYAFSDRFLFRYGGGWMSLSYDDWDGSLVFANAFLEYWPLSYAGFGVGYRYMSADVEYDPGDKKEEYDVDLPGTLVYVIFGF